MEYYGEYCEDLSYLYQGRRCRGTGPGGWEPQSGDGGSREKGKSSGGSQEKGKGSGGSGGTSDRRRRKRRAEEEEPGRPAKAQYLGESGKPKASLEWSGSMEWPGSLERPGGGTVYNGYFS